MVMITVVHDVVSQCCAYQHVELYCHGRETFPGKLMKDILCTLQGNTSLSSVGMWCKMKIKKTKKQFAALVNPYFIHYRT